LDPGLSRSDLGCSGRQKGRGDDPEFDMDPEQLRDAIDRAKQAGNSESIKSLERTENMNGNTKKQKRGNK
jgi:hypothetical protein